MKMKKIVCIMVLACFVLSAAFAQQKPATSTPAKSEATETSKEKKSSFGVDLFQLVKGFIASDSDSKYNVFIISGGYEALVAPHFSLGIDASFYLLKFNSVDGNYFSVAAEGRYYPMSERFEKFFLGTTLGFNSLSIDGKTKPADNGGFQGLITSLKAGYKLITSGNIYLEPSMSYVLSKSGGGGALGALLDIPTIPTPNGWNGGLRLGLLF
jgi:hypothetical protein